MVAEPADAGQTPAAATIDEYIAAFPAEVRTRLEQVRAAIREVAPAAEETFAYGMPAFTLHGRLVYFAGFTQHIGFYPAGSNLEADGDPELAEVAAYRTGKGTLQFPHNRPLPLALIRKIVAVRVQENLARRAEKRRPRAKR